MFDFCGSSLPCCSALLLCAVAALAAPRLLPQVRRRREAFLLAMGFLAALLSWAWSRLLLAQALLRPLKVCGAMFLGAVVYAAVQGRAREKFSAWALRRGARAGVAAAVAAAGLLAMVLTAPVAALFLADMLRALSLEEDARAHAAVLGCLALSLGAVMSPVGGVLPGLVLSRLAGAAYPVGASYLLELVGALALPAVFALSAAAAALPAKPAAAAAPAPAPEPLNLWGVLAMTGETACSLAGLILLGEGLTPALDRFLLHCPPWALFWANGAAAYLDGGTLAACEISPRMAQAQLRCIVLGAVVAAGALSSGAPQNAVVARRLGIPEESWARAGIPAAAVLMAGCFCSLLIAAARG